jgi:succinate dehydrogenase / fumarate reductase cytochrome b subunit
MRLPAERPLSPHLQVYRMLFTMVLSGLHRMSGLYLSLTAFGLVAWLVAASMGPEPYASAVACLSTLPMRVALLLALAAFWYHLFAGLRHLAWDLGYGFERKAARASGAVIALLAAAAFASSLLMTPAGRFLAGVP